MNGVVGNCRKCLRPMGSRRNHKRHNLPKHHGQGYCSGCYTTAVVREPVVPKPVVVVEPRRLLMERPDWMDSAPCSQVDPEIFYADKGRKDQIAAAKTVCRPCEYRSLCLNYALINKDQWGVWGGLTGKERLGLEPLTDLAEVA